MSRIRSIHPGLFTDEAFVAMSDGAQVLFMGLWTEADDWGVFEWKPLTIKMRLRPASTSPVEPAMDEMVSGNCVRRFTVDGREYGAIRNFCRFQRPKKPKSLYPMTPEIRTYVASASRSSELEEVVVVPGSPPAQDEASRVPKKAEPLVRDRTPVPTKSEIAPQMEDGGGRREKEPPIPPSGGTNENFAAFWEIWRTARGEAANPRKSALAAFDRACLTETAGVILAGAKAARAVIEEAGDWETRHAPMAATWLNQARWQQAAEMPNGEADVAMSPLVHQALDLAADRLDRVEMVAIYRLNLTDPAAAEQKARTYLEAA